MTEISDSATKKLQGNAPGNAGDPKDSGSPTWVRWQIVGLLGIIAALTYLDRLNLSIAGEYIQNEFAFSTQTMGWILSSFMLGYALFQVPVGWLGDRFGPRNLLVIALLWWSLFTAATAIAPNLPLAGWFGVAWSFAIVRFLIGVGESATFPNSNKVVEQGTPCGWQQSAVCWRWIRRCGDTTSHRMDHAELGLAGFLLHLWSRGNCCCRHLAPLRNQHA